MPDLNHASREAIIAANPRSTAIELDELREQNQRLVRAARGLLNLRDNPGSRGAIADWNYAHHCALEALRAALEVQS